MPPLWSHAIKLIGVKILKELEEKQLKEFEEAKKEYEKYSEDK